MAKKRNKLEIVRDILEVIKSKSGKIKPTHILYKSNLSHEMMNLYLDELKEKELIEEIQKDKTRTYTITKRGIEYLNQYRRISEFTESFGLA